MQIRRVMALCVALFFAAGSFTLAQKAEKDEKKRSKQEQQDIEALVKIVDGVSMGQQQAPADLTVTWDSNHFVKGQDGKTYVPFTINVDRSKLASPALAVYVRAPAKEPAVATGTIAHVRTLRRLPARASIGASDVAVVTGEVDGGLGRGVIDMPSK